jgi:hypothetical protein
MISCAQRSGLGAVAVVCDPSAWLLHLTLKIDDEGKSILLEPVQPLSAVE